MVDYFTQCNECLVAISTSSPLGIPSSDVIACLDISIKGNCILTPPGKVGIYVYKYTYFFFFSVEENGVTWLWSLKTTTIFVYGPYFDPMTPPLGVLKSQSRTSTHLGSFPGRVPTVLPV